MTGCLDQRMGLHHIACIKGVQQTHTYFVMEEVKNSSKMRVQVRREST